MPVFLVATRHSSPIMSHETPDQSAKINQAGDACLERCTSSPSPFSVLRDFLKELQEAGWPQGDIKVVEEATMRALNGQ